MHSRILVDRALSCRLERAEAHANACFVDTRARLMPQSGAQWIEVAGTYAMYDGPRSPCTQTFGLGMFALPTVRDMERLEAFFKERQAPVLHEVSPLADKALLPLLNERGYRPVELSSVMFLPLAHRVSSEVNQTRSMHVRAVDREERELWARIATEGWREYTGIADLMHDLMCVSASREDFAAFLVELEGKPIAAGGLAIHDGIALLAGASTIPEFRRRGAQRALLESRFEYARRAGCDFALMCAEPGSGSQRNAERQGFRIAYTRIKWGLA
jgi:GNAT superfamily N-acetyltransferase